MGVGYNRAEGAKGRGHARGDTCRRMLSLPTHPPSCGAVVHNHVQRGCRRTQARSNRRGYRDRRSLSVEASGLQSRRDQAQKRVSFKMGKLRLEATPVLPGPLEGSSLNMGKLRLEATPRCHHWGAGDTCPPLTTPQSRATTSRQPRNWDPTRKTQSTSAVQALLAPVSHVSFPSHLLDCTTREEGTQANVKRLQDPAPFTYGSEGGVGKTGAVRDVQVAQPTSACLQNLEEIQTRRVECAERNGGVWTMFRVRMG